MFGGEILRKNITPVYFKQKAPDWWRYDYLDCTQMFFEHSGEMIESLLLCYGNDINHVNWSWLLVIDMWDEHPRDKNRSKVFEYMWQQLSCEFILKSHQQDEHQNYFTFTCSIYFENSYLSWTSLIYPEKIDETVFLAGHYDLTVERFPFFHVTRVMKQCLPYLDQPWTRIRG